MKPLENHILFIDHECPMCKVYGGSFQQLNMLDATGVQSHTESLRYECIDQLLSKDKIALLDTQTHTVTYGIESLIKILSHNMPLILTIYQLYPVRSFLTRLYSFISYNRKVIMPSAIDYGCQPSFHTRYRMLYIFFAIAVSTLVLHIYAVHIPSHIPQGSIYRDLGISVGQSVCQYLWMYRIDLKSKINYIGSLNTVSLMASLLLTLVMIINSMFVISELAFLVLFGLVVTWMVYEHYRRVQLLRLPLYLCFTWVLYRLLILICIL
jgi:hypothetical protein